MSTVQKLKVASTNAFRLRGVYDTLVKPRTYPTDAVVTATLYNAAGTTPIAGAGGISMPHVAGTSGATTEYRGILPASVVLVAGTSYLLKGTATLADGSSRVFQKSCLAEAG